MRGRKEVSKSNIYLIKGKGLILPVNYISPVVSSRKSSLEKSSNLEPVV
jgi:hypothetical protein